MNEYAIALGGGGTKGAYHIGVWKALCEMDIKISAVTGCSIGSLNGALLAQGDYEKAYEIWQNISGDNVVDFSDTVSENFFDVKNLAVIISDIHNNSGLDTTPLKNLAKSCIDEEKLRKAPIDFGLVTFDMTNRKEVPVFLEDIPNGMLVDYIMASAALPGLKKAVIEDKQYIDGGVRNNIPADMLIKKGIKNIIAVDVGGIGITKGLAPKGINVINIKTSEKIIGLLDFNKENIDKTIRAGYIDCLKTFGRVEGNIYAFNAVDYHRQRQKYSQKIIDGIEYAARIFGVDRYRIYRFDDLVNAVLEEYDRLSKKKNISDGFKLNEKQLLIKFTGYILGESIDDSTVKIFSGIIGDITNAANSTAYFWSMQK